MKKKTLTALKKSIVKWEKNVLVQDPRSMSLGVSSCPLCVLFFDKDCVGCPIYEKNHKHRICNQTPYDTVVGNHQNWLFAHNEVLEQYYKKLTIRAAKREVKFLKSLLPTGGE